MKHVKTFVLCNARKCFSASARLRPEAQDEGSARHAIADRSSGSADKQLRPVWRRGRLAYWASRTVQTHNERSTLFATMRMAVSLGLGWMARAAPSAPRASMEWVIKRGRRARALSSATPNAPCTRTVRIPGEQANSRTLCNAECRVQTVQPKLRLHDNARLAPGARGRS